VLQWAFKLKRDEHSDFTLCFQSLEQAHCWFDALSQVLVNTRMRHAGMVAMHTASTATGGAFAR
jgi:hypothetical protein